MWLILFSLKWLEPSRKRRLLFIKKIQINNNIRYQTPENGVFFNAQIHKKGGEMMRKLNKRQQTFAEAYAIPGTEMYGNATESALYAGYSKKTAYSQGQRLLKNVEVQKYIREVQEKLFDDNIMTGKEVLYHLTRTARAETREVDAVVAKTAEYIENPKTGNPVLVYNENIEMISKPPKISDQNKALELLGKHHRLFTDKQEIEHSGIEIIVDYGDEDEEG